MSAWALLPSELLVIANRRVPESLELARYYAEKRGIPPENLLALDTTAEETCSRDQYEHDIAQPVRSFLKNHKAEKSLKAFVTIFGIPLKVQPPELNSAEQLQLNRLQEQRTFLKKELKVGKGSIEAERLQQQLELLGRKIRILKKEEYAAALDSELALVMKPEYALNSWQPNPLFSGYQHLQLENTVAEVLPGSRLDGPSVQIVKRMIADSLVAEREGLQGRAYFDAKGPPNIKQNLQGYARYDQSLHLAAEQLKTLNLMPVVVDSQKRLFQAGEAPDAALYCGWYSLSHYIDAFDWRRGAIGYHIASGECETLRAGPGQGWCKRMLEDGIAATIGPVAEPYIQAFPEPDVFFRFLTGGEDNLVEAYFHSLPYLSWQMVLIGDPLYRPFPR